ncbi:unnamed protein product [Boreogadus saida]
MSDVMMRADLEPVLWPGSHGAPGGRSEVRARPLARVTWGSGWEVRGQSPSSGRVTWGSRWEVRGQSPSSGPGHMGLQGGQRSEPVLWPGSHGAPGGRSEVRARPLARVTWGSGWEVRGQSPSSEVEQGEETTPSPAS